ncbi:sigma-54-dependent transcriptional regulator [Spirochaetota bacterium]
MAKKTAIKFLSILVLDDEKIVRKEISEFLDNYSYDVYQAPDPKTAFELLRKNNIDIMVIDIKLPGSDGLEVLKRVKNEYPQTEAIMITGHGDTNTVVRAMKYGAFDFFNKPLDHVEILNSIERTKKYVELRNRYVNLRTEYNLLSKEVHEKTGAIIGKSKVMKHAVDLALKAARSETASVLITGPSGVGKELIARVIHYASRRKDHYFFPVNCSAIPETLIESEFFGHAKGAFTGAIEHKKGYFELAHNGTLFLDEIGDMPSIIQGKILRAIEDKKIKRLGAPDEKSFDVRIISATNKDVKELIKKKKFRHDLLYRLNVLEIEIPPLRERKEDIPLLIDYYLKLYASQLNKNIKGVHKRAINALQSYDFPGNVRELKNMMERACILCHNEMLDAHCFPLITADTNGNEEVKIQSVFHTLDLELLEKKAIREALDETHNNVTKAARLLHLSRHALDRRIQKYKLL